MTLGADEIPDWWKPYALEFPQWHAWKGIAGLVYARWRTPARPLWSGARTP